MLRSTSASSFQFDSDDLLANIPDLCTEDPLSSFIFDQDDSSSAAPQKHVNSTPAAVFQQWLNSVALPPAASLPASKKDQEVESTCSASSAGSSDDEKCSNASPSKKTTSKKRKRGTSAPKKEEDKAKKRREANRVSAAASRERKKRYVKDLEKKVQKMESEHAEMRQTMTVTQMENARLRSLVERLARAATRGVAAQDGESLIDALHSEEPSLKRRKICTEITIPVQQHVVSDSVATPNTATMEHDFACFDETFQKVELPEDNPFNVSFWDKVPTGKAMLFVMIFCIALFVGIGGNARTDLFYGGNRGAVGNQMPHARVGRRILSECLGNEHQRISELTSFPGVEHPTREMISHRISSVLSQVQRLVDSLNGGSNTRDSVMVESADPLPFDDLDESGMTTTTTTTQRAPRRRLQHHGDIEHTEF